MDTAWWGWRGILVRRASAFDEGLEDVTFEARLGLFGFLLERLQRVEQVVYAVDEAIVDDLLVLEGLDLVFAIDTLLVDLVLLCTNEGALVDIGMDFDVGIVRQLESVLGIVVSLKQKIQGEDSYPFAVVNGHDCGGYDNMLDRTVL